MKLQYLVNSAYVDFHNTGVSFVEDESSSLSEELRGDRTISLNFSASTFTHFRAFKTKAQLETGGEWFVLTQEPVVTKVNESNYTYEMQLESLGNLLKYFIIRDTANVNVRMETSFSFTGKALDFLNLIVANANRATGYSVSNPTAVQFQYGGVGANLVDIEKSVSFSGNTIRDAIDMIADAFCTEWEILFVSEGLYKVYFRKVEYFVTNPIDLGYGARRGLLSGVQRSEEEGAIKRLYVVGTERNINRQMYIDEVELTYRVIKKSSRLLLPVLSMYQLPYNGVTVYASRRIMYDGSKYAGLTKIPPDSTGVWVQGSFNHLRTNVLKSYNSETSEWHYYGMPTVYVFPEEAGINVQNARVYEIDPNGEFIEDVTEDVVENDKLVKEAVTNNKEAIYTNEEVYPSGFLKVLSYTPPTRTTPDEDTTNYSNAVITIGEPVYTNGDTFIGHPAGTTFVKKTIPSGTFVGWCIGVERYGVSDYYAVVYLATPINTSLNGNSVVLNQGYIPVLKTTLSSNVANSRIIDYNAEVLDGESPQIVFQSGMLAGKEFGGGADQSGKFMNRLTSVAGGVTYYTGATLQLVPKDIDGFTMPQNVLWNEEYIGYVPAVLDSFAIYNIDVPNKYYADAEFELLKAAVKYMYDNCQPKYSLSAKLDNIAMADYLDKRSGDFMVGAKIQFTDNYMPTMNVRIRTINTPTKNKYAKSVTFESGIVREQTGKKIIRKTK